VSMNDPIADFLTRIRNASAARHATCQVSTSKMKEQLARILAEQGYIAEWTVAGEGTERSLRVKLKYGPDGAPIIRGLRRVSRPGRRDYKGATDLPKVLNGLGTAVVSTSQGLLTDGEARRRNVGGEIVCNVW
jgi:small subunit ribosomal protein S8